MLLYLIFITLFIVIAVGLVSFLLTHDRGAKTPASALLMAAAFGLLALVIALLLELLIPESLLSPSAPIGSSFLGFMAVGLIEESAKFVPLALVIYRKPYFNAHVDGIIYFAIVGMVFGLIENIEYVLGAGPAAGIGRLILTPFFHAATAGITGFFLAEFKIQHRPWYRIGLILAAFVFLHGLYDFGLGSGIPVLLVVSLMITLLFSMGLFLFYMRANELDQAEGLTALGNRKYCRNCGRPNINRSLYCEYCGKLA